MRSLGAGTVGRSVLVRIGRLGLECDHLAEAIAILGPGAPLRHAASLADLDREAAEAAADRLRAADVLAAERELDFVHPIVHEALLAELPAARRAALHSGAARLLLAEDAPADRVAAHLLSAEPYGEAWVVDALRAAARQAMARGAPDAAASYLRRALAEPPAGDAAPGGPPGARARRGAAARRRRVPGPARGPGAGPRAGAARPRRPGAGATRCSAWGAVTRCAPWWRACSTTSERLDEELVERLEAHLLGGGATDLTATRRILERTAPWFARARRGRGERSADARRAGLDRRRHRPVGDRGVRAGAAGAV